MYMYMKCTQQDRVTCDWLTCRYVYLKIKGTDFGKFTAFATLKQPRFLICARELGRKYRAALHVKNLPRASTVDITEP